MNALLNGVFNLEGFGGPPEVVQPDDGVSTVRSPSELNLIVAHKERGVSPTSRGFDLEKLLSSFEIKRQYVKSSPVPLIFGYPFNLLCQI